MDRLAVMRRLQEIADNATARSKEATRHKCFVSYHVADADEVEDFLDDFGDVFIPRCLGVTDDDDFVDSDDQEYIKRRIREKYLTDSTVTIVLLGECTWSRRFVDWEIASSLRNDSANKRSGLLAIPLPSMENSAHLPKRIEDNWSKDAPDASYALYRSYPASKATLERAISRAFHNRTEKAELVDNTRALRQRSSSCP